eukprot:scaffold243172_cov21-Tisochrysis_lutea.AAC.1
MYSTAQTHSCKDGTATLLNSICPEALSRASCTPQHINIHARMVLQRTITAPAQRRSAELAVLHSTCNRRGINHNHFPHQHPTRDVQAGQPHQGLELKQAPVMHSHTHMPRLASCISRHPEILSTTATLPHQHLPRDVQAGQPRQGLELKQALVTHLHTHAHPQVAQARQLLAQQSKRLWTRAQFAKQASA